MNEDLLDLHDHIGPIKLLKESGVPACAGMTDFGVGGFGRVGMEVATTAIHIGCSPCVPPHETHLTSTSFLTFNTTPNARHPREGGNPALIDTYSLPNILPSLPKK